MNRLNLFLLAPVAAALAVPALAQSTTQPADPMKRQAPTYESQMQTDPAKARTPDMNDRTNAPLGQPPVPQAPPQPEVPQPMTPPENPMSPPQPPQPAPEPPRAQ